MILVVRGSLELSPSYKTALTTFSFSNSTPGDPTPRSPPKKRSKATKDDPFPFYIKSWLIFFQQTVSRFEIPTTHLSLIYINPFIEQAISTTVTSIVTAAFFSAFSDLPKSTTAIFVPEWRAPNKKHPNHHPPCPSSGASTHGTTTIFFT